MLAREELIVGVASPQHFSEWLGLGRWLSAPEQAQASRLRFEADRRAYVVAHALQRAMLAGEQRVHPSRVALRADDEGAPVVTDEPGLYTSLSHTRNAVACAMTRSAPVGIDVEIVDPSRADDELLEPFMDAAAGDFFGHWTALEAFWKCKGVGLGGDNPRIRLQGLRNARAEVKFENGMPAGQVIRLQPVSGCAVAVALDRPSGFVPRLRVFRCQSAADLQQLWGSDTVMNFFARLRMTA